LVKDGSNELGDQQRRVGSKERVRAFLEAHGLAQDVVEFEQSTKTAAMAAEAMGCELGQIVKSLVVVVDQERPVVALVAGDRRGDLDAIAIQLEGSEARMADADRVREVTGYAIGGVSPFDLPGGLPVLVDDSLTRFSTVYPAAGTPSSMVGIGLDQLVALTEGRVARVAH
jgi:Cys-tRNA(Pro) deacylase